jgi:hypothetical protein
MALSKRSFVMEIVVPGNGVGASGRNVDAMAHDPTEMERFRALGPEGLERVIDQLHRHYPSLPLWLVTAEAVSDAEPMLGVGEEPRGWMGFVAHVG